MRATEFLIERASSILFHYKNQLTKKWVAIADAKNKKQEPPNL